MKQQRKFLKINKDLTLMVISLHAGGYIFDFQDMDSQFVCLQNNHSFPAAGVQISTAGHSYDQLSKSFKYVYAIDTNSGLKGLMLSNNPSIVKQVPAKKLPIRFVSEIGFPCN
jgi:hypothetical protein